METKDELVLVSSAVLPRVFLQVLEAKKLLDEGRAGTINEAARMAGISRSAYYKYKDSVFPFFEMSHEQVFTLFFIVYDVPGVLSGILKAFAEESANILTINQNIPLNRIANITISFKMNKSIQPLMDTLKSVNGVKKIEIISKELLA